MGVNESALMVVMFLFIHYMLEMWLKEDLARQHWQYLAASRAGWVELVRESEIVKREVIAISKLARRMGGREDAGWRQTLY